MPSGSNGTLTNCTLSENGGGAILWGGPSCGPGYCYGSLRLTNTIIAQSSGPGCGEGE